MAVNEGWLAPIKQEVQAWSKAYKGPWPRPEWQHGVTVSIALNLTNKSGWAAPEQRVYVHVGPLMELPEVLAAIRAELDAWTQRQSEKALADA